MCAGPEAKKAKGFCRTGNCLQAIKTARGSQTSPLGELREMRETPIFGHPYPGVETDENKRSLILVNLL
jgi:hypothetical protein